MRGCSFVYKRWHTGYMRKILTLAIIMALATTGCVVQIPALSTDIVDPPRSDTTIPVDTELAQKHRDCEKFYRQFDESADASELPEILLRLSHELQGTYLDVYAFDLGVLSVMMDGFRTGDLMGSTPEEAWASTDRLWDKTIPAIEDRCGSLPPL